MLQPPTFLYIFPHGLSVRFDRSLLPRSHPPSRSRRVECATAPCFVACSSPGSPLPPAGVTSFDQPARAHDLRGSFSSSIVPFVGSPIRVAPPTTGGLRSAPKSGPHRACSRTFFSLPRCARSCPRPTRAKTRIRLPAAGVREPLIPGTSTRIRFDPSRHSTLSRFQPPQTEES